MPKSAKELSDKPFDLYERSDLLFLSKTLSEVNGEEKSYLKEELDKYSKALDTITNPRADEKTIQTAIDTIATLPDFLMEVQYGKTNLTRFLDDGSDLCRNDSDTVLRTLDKVGKLLGIDFKIAENQKKQESLNPDAEHNRRPTVQGVVDNYASLMAAAQIGKNFLDPGCNDYNAVGKMLDNLNTTVSEMTQILNENDDFEEQEAKSYKETIDQLKKFRDAVSVLYTDFHSDLISKADHEKKCSKALKDIQEFQAAMTDGIGKTGYERLKANTDGVGRRTSFDDKFFEDGLSALNKVLNLDLTEKKLEEAKPMTVRTGIASEVIEKMKAANTKNEALLRKDFKSAQHIFANIMAVRMGVDSIVGDGNSLKKPLLNTTAKQLAYELMDNKYFKDFMETLKDDPKQFDKAMKAATTGSGHGGTLDIMFTEYLNKLPAGQLHNDPAIERYMPRVIDRIEELQRQAKVTMKSGNKPANEIAEVLALRQSINAVRNNKEGLKVQIPADNRLIERQRNIKANPKFMDSVNNPEVLKKLTKGHGGRMQEIHESIQKEAPKAFGPRL